MTANMPDRPVTHESHAPALTARAESERQRLRSATLEAAQWPGRVLADMLSFNSGTAYARRNDLFRVRTVDEYRRAVPIQDYSAHQPWIERMAAGESNVLTADDPAVFFTSSGTTGDHKKIPVTPRFMKTTFFPFYFAAWAPLTRHFPDVMARPDAVLNLKHDPLVAPPRTSSGRPHVGASQVDFGTVFGEPFAAEPGTFAPWSVLPPTVDPHDHLGKAYCRLRMAVEHDLRCVIGINPAMVAALPFQLRQWWPRIVREVADGTLNGAPFRAPNRPRARQLQELAEWFGVVRPAHVWPNMRAIFCWTTGVASLYMGALREEFGTHVTLLPAPVAASEGPTAVALDRHARAGSLVVTAALHEFVDADSDLKPDAETLLGHELESGREYHVLLSHVGGLYRYAAGDVVRVVDVRDGTPRLEYAGRGARSDVAGERLRDSQVIRALKSALESAGLVASNVACRAGDIGGEKPRPSYRFAIASTQTWTPEETEAFASLLDDALAVESGAYRAARSSGRLAPPSAFTVEPARFQQEWERRVADGVRPTQVKDRLFRSDAASWSLLTGEDRT